MGERDAMVDNFWRAYDTLLCKETAKQIQTLGRILKDSKAIQYQASKQFLWCKLEHPSHIFRHHLNVRRLGVWLLQTLFMCRPKGESPERSLLVIVRDRVRDTYLLVGATPAQLGEQDEFGTLFRKVVTADTSLRSATTFSTNLASRSTQTTSI